MDFFEFEDGVLDFLGGKTGVWVAEAGEDEGDDGGGQGVKEEVESEGDDPIAVVGGGDADVDAGDKGEEAQPVKPIVVRFVKRRSDAATDVADEKSCEQVPVVGKEESSFGEKSGATPRRPRKKKQCPQCGKNVCHLVTHMRIHAGEKPHSCQQCGKAFMILSRLRRHAVVHTGKKPFSCHLCLKRFNQNSNCRSHYRTVHNQQPPKIDATDDANDMSDVLTGQGEHKTRLSEREECLEATSDKKQEVMVREKKQLCLQCGKYVRRLNVHMRFHTGKKLHSCQSCKQVFVDSSTLKRHAVVHTGMKPFSCHLCLKRFSQGSKCRSHYWAVHNRQPPKLNPTDNAVKVKDTLTGQRQNGNDQSTGHHVPSDQKEMTVGGRKKKQCPQCGKHVVHMHLHMQTHTDERPFSCRVCGKAFKVESYLRKHMRCSHNGREVPRMEHERDLCQQTFDRSARLTKHVVGHAKENKTLKVRNHMTARKDQRPHVCHICTKAFRGRQLLERHLRTHTGEKPFACKVCHTSFSRQSNMRRHMLLVHTGEKPFSCRLCARAFKLKGALLDHVTSHSEAHPNGRTNEGRGGERTAKVISIMKTAGRGGPLAAAEL